MQSVKVYLYIYKNVSTDVFTRSNHHWNPIDAWFLSVTGEKCCGLEWKVIFELEKSLTEHFEHEKSLTEHFEHEKSLIEHLEHEKSLTEHFEHEKSLTEHLEHEHFENERVFRV